MRSCRDVLESSVVVLRGGGPTVARSFEEFFEAVHDRLGRALYLLTGSAAEADELSQEALVRVYERWERVSDMTSPEGYLFRIALNLHRSRLRGIARLARHVFQLPLPSDPAAEVEMKDEIARAMASLPAGQRSAIVLVEWLGMDAEEASRVLGIEPVSVRARLSRARSALRTLMEQNDD